MKKIFGLTLAAAAVAAIAAPAAAQDTLTQQQLCTETNDGTFNAELGYNTGGADLTWAAHSQYDLLCANGAVVPLDSTATTTAATLPVLTTIPPGAILVGTLVVIGGVVAGQASDGT